MNLPRNAYARDYARKAGRLLAQYHAEERATRADELWVYVQDARFWARRWRLVPWCPIELGDIVSAGGLQGAVLAVLGKLLLLPAAVVGVVLGIMYLGVLVDRAYVPPPPCVEVPDDP